MKSLPAKCVIATSVALCVLCAWQWARESSLQQEVVRLKQTNMLDRIRLTGVEGERERAWNELRRLDQRQSLLRASADSNQVLLTETQARERRLVSERDNLSRQLSNFKAALEEANRSISNLNHNVRVQNNVVVRQNEALKSLAAERDLYAERINERTREYNDLAQKYNQWVESVKLENIRRANSTNTVSEPIIHD